MMIAFFITLAAIFSLTMAVAWRLALRTGRSGWIDAIWSFAVGLGGAAAALATVGNEPTARQFLVAGLVLIWSLRLGIHIVLRTARGGDDPRYAQLRREWGSDFRNRLFWFLQIQAVVAFVLALSVMAAGHNPAPAFALGDQAGIALLLMAVAGETLADRQLAAFRANPANEGKICDAKLWGVSRHPNYFFEWVGWLAYAVIAVDPVGNYPWGWAALAAPALMYWLLVHASGIPPLEAHMLRSRGEKFRRYQARVNAFWPGLPKAAAAINGR